MKRKPLSVDFSFGSSALLLWHSAKQLSLLNLQVHSKWSWKSPKIYEFAFWFAFISLLLLYCPLSFMSVHRSLLLTTQFEVVHKSLDGPWKTSRLWYFIHRRQQLSFVIFQFKRSIPCWAIRYLIKRKRKKLRTENSKGKWGKFFFSGIFGNFFFFFICSHDVVVFIF